MAENDHEQWQWQEPGKAWHGIGIYHVTLVVPSREALLGELEIPENDPKQAKVRLTPLGEQVKDCMRSIPDHHPEIQIIALRMMPDHVHVILHVQRTMPTGIKATVRGIWQGIKKIGREYTSSVIPNGIRGNQRCEGGDLNSIQDNQRRDEEYLNNIQDNQRRIDPIFTEVPFIRPLSHRGQLQTMIRYVQMNPQRLATKRLMPGFFRVQHDVEIAGRKYDAIGNIKILQTELPGASHAEIHANVMSTAVRSGVKAFAPVHVRSVWVEDAERHGDDTRLREYKNGCIAAARQGTVMVSPFISPHEKAVLNYLLLEHHAIIYIADNGFGEYYKPFSALFDAVADGRMLILSPWQHDPEKKHVTRAECVMMNKMAEEICQL